MSEKTVEPSSDFVDAVTTGSSIVTECGLCGRTIFEDDEHAGDWEPGELEKLREREEQNPDKVVGYGCSVAIGRINGKQVVTNCVCNGLRKYEDWIWSHRHIIAAYVQARTEHVAEDALRDEAEAEFLADAIERTSVDKGKKFAKCQGCGGYFDEMVLDGKRMCPRCSRNKDWKDVGGSDKDDDQDDRDRWRDDGDDCLPF